MLVLPRSARLAVWAGGWLDGEATLADVLDRVQGDDEPHTVAGIPAHSAPESLGTALAALRANGVTALRVALPRPGDPYGLSGPPDLNADAVAAGEAVLAVGAPVALVPSVETFGPPGDQGHLVSWLWRDAVRPVSGPSLTEAEHDLSDALLAAGSTLTALDVAAWRPEVAQLLDDIRSGRSGEPLPRVFSPQAQLLAARAARLLAVCAVALDDDGGALSAARAAERRAALQPLERAARHALAAACNARADSPST
jgi:hypothetical protein